LAQIVYYFYAASKCDAPPSFVVPTGNFGDVFAGYAAMKCGLPIAKLVVASNSNDILTRFFATGSMTPEPVQITFSPSMDIQVSSNFERLLFDLCDRDGAQVRTHIESLKNTGGFSVTQAQLVKARQIFAAGRADDDQTLLTMAAVYRDKNIFLDPHTAVGIKVAQDLTQELSQPVICLATAHAAKFPQLRLRYTNNPLNLPEKTLFLIKRPERTKVLPAHKGQIVAFIREHKG
jgi:threonine synthase